MSHSLRLFPHWRREILVAGFVLAILTGGCATTRSRRAELSRLALRSPPVVSPAYMRADQAIVAAFFAANGISLTPEEVDQILPPASLSGRMDRHAFRRIANRHKRVLLVLKADEATLTAALEHNVPLLMYLPAEWHNQPRAILFIPVAWDRRGQTLELLEGNGEILHLSQADFFTRREPLKQAALALARPRGRFPLPLSREHKLVIADFWLDQGFYRRAGTAYAELTAPSDATNVAALIGQGNALVHRKRYAEAIPYYRAALLSEPDNPRVLNNLAYALASGGGELMTALRHATKAVQLDPENPFYLETLGSIHLKLGDGVAATHHLEHAWARAAKQPPEVQIPIMDQLTRAWLAADRTDLAWQVAQTRQRLFPEYRFPKDILSFFPALVHPTHLKPRKKMPLGD